MFGFGRQAFGPPPPTLDVERAGVETGNLRRSEVKRSEEVHDLYERTPYPAPLRIWTHIGNSARTWTVAESSLTRERKQTPMLPMGVVLERVGILVFFALASRVAMLA